MVLIDLTKSIWLNLLRNRIKIDLNFGERFHSSGRQRWDIIKITALQLACMLSHSGFDPEIVAHCTVNTFAYRSLTFDTAMAKTEHLPSEILEEKMVIPPPIPLTMHIKSVSGFPSFRERTQKRN